jgi:hypothetical protein
LAARGQLDPYATALLGVGYVVGSVPFTIS